MTGSEERRVRKASSALLRAAALLLLAGCATSLGSLTESERVGRYTIHYAPGADGEKAALARAIEAASPNLERWAAKDLAVDVFVVPDHRSLESAVRRRGYPWLRAWATYDEVIVQAPGTWRPSDADLRELMAHELTHCLMYQRSATRLDWAQKGIPLWFREGMAAWTSDQGHRWMSLEDLARVYEQDDPIASAESMYQERSAAVYAAAFYAFGFLVQRYGAAAIERMLEVMQRGAQFAPAFRQATGVDEAALLGDFRRYVQWRGFRGSGKPVRENPPAP